MTIGQYIKHTDIEIYKKLARFAYTDNHKYIKSIELGDKPENLMKHDSYKRVNGKLVQRGWG